MKKITITAIKKAIKNHYGLNDMVEVNHTEKSITFARRSLSLVTFEIFGAKNQYIGWSICGHANYVMCDWLNEITKFLEGDK